MSEQPHDQTGANEPPQEPPHQQGAPQEPGHPDPLQGRSGPQQDQPQKPYQSDTQQGQQGQQYQQGQAGQFGQTGQQRAQQSHPQQPYQQGQPGQPGPQQSQPQQPYQQGQPGQLGPQQSQPQQPYQQGQPGQPSQPRPYQGQQQPGQPPHQQGFPPQGRPQQYQQQQPGQPQQFGQPQGTGWAPVNKSTGGSFDLGALIKIWVTSFKQFFTGATNAGLDTVRSSNDSPTTKWFWSVAALVNAILMILVAVVGVLRFSSQGYLPEDFSVGLELVLAVLVPIVISGVYLSTRALTIMALFKTQKRAIGFHQSANIAAVGFVISAPLLVLALIATALDVKLFFIITAVGFVFTVVFAEVLVYEELKKQTLPESATILHSAFTAVWVSLITYLVSELVSVPLKTIATALFLSWLY